MNHDQEIKKIADLVTLGFNTRLEDAQFVIYSVEMPHAEVRVARADFVEMPAAFIIGEALQAAYDLGLEEEI